MELLRTLGKIFAWLFLALILLAALIFAWALFVNRHDESLTPEAEALLSYRAAEIPNAENGFVAMAGFNAPPGSDWKKIGAERIASHNERVQAATLIKTPEAVPGETLEFITGNDSDPVEPLLKMAQKYSEAELRASLQALPQRVEEVERQLRANAELIIRYEAAIASPRFSETAIHSMSQFFPYTASQNMTFTRRLLLARAALALLDGDAEPAIDFLERDMRFWRMVMRSDSSLLTAMMIQAYVAEDLHFLQRILPRIDVRTPLFSDRLRHLLAPLSAEERSLFRVLNENSHMTARLLRNPEEETRKSCQVVGDNCDPSWQDTVTGWFYQPQATINAYTAEIYSWRKRIDLSPKEFAARRSSLVANNETDTMKYWGGYNWMGKMLVDVSGGQEFAISYIGRRFDLAAMLQLTRAQLEIQLAGIDAAKTPEAVPEFLAQAGPETRNPYTELPFDWDEKCRCLSFSPQEEAMKHYASLSLTPALSPSAD